MLPGAARDITGCLTRGGPINRDNDRMRRAWVYRLPFVLVLICGVTSGTPRAQGSPDVPPVSDAAHAAGFVDVRTVVPDAVVDLRYATANNFTHTQLYP